MHPQPTAYLDLAYQYARHRQNPVEARKAFAKADKSVLTENAKSFRLCCLGIIEYLEGDNLGAQRELEASLKMMEQTRHAPYRDGRIAIAKAYLACVVAKQGDRITGKRYFAEAKEYLEATKETDLIAQCQTALRG